MFSWRDVFKIRTVSEPQLSTDGKHLLYVRSLPEGLNDSRKTYIWIVNVRTAEQHQWSKGVAGSPRWLPDGTHISYQAHGSTGQWKYYIGTAENSQGTVLALPSGAGNVTWSPDGRSVAFTQFVAEPAATLGIHLPKPDSVQWAEPARVFTQKHFFSDGAGEAQPGYTHIFIMSASGGGRPKQITEGPYNHNSGFAWTPDSKSIVFSSARGKNWEVNYYDENLYRVQVDNGAINQLTSFPYGARYPTISSDGKYIAFTGTTHNKKDYEQGELYVTSKDGSGLQSISKRLDREISNFQWTANGNHLLATYDDHGITKLAKFGLNGQIRVLSEQLDDYSVSSKGLMALTLTKNSKPADLFLRMQNGKVRQLTHENDSLFNHIKTGLVRELPVRSSTDGAQVGSWLTLPPDYDVARHYPLILSIHGGPHGDVGPNWSVQDQLFAAAGYAVLKVNYRGSLSYGFAFADKVYGNFPGPAYDDLISAVDAAIAVGIADPDRLFVTGGSAGGQLTTWIVGKTIRFKAAAAVKPVINLLAVALSNDQYPNYAYYEFSKPLWRDPLAYWNSSPLSLSDKVQTPTLLLVGEQDRRTPVSESVQFYHALQLHNIPTAIAIVPQASHGTLDSRPSQLINDTYMILDWFGRYGGVPLNNIFEKSK